MSHFSFQQVKFHPEVLIESLEAMGFVVRSDLANPTITVHNDYQNETTIGVKANIVIKAGSINNVRGNADIGFKINPETGMIEEVIEDAWATRCYKPKHEGATSFMQDIGIGYVNHFVKEQIKRNPQLKGVQVIGSRVEVTARPKPKQVVRR